MTGGYSHEIVVEMDMETKKITLRASKDHLPVNVSKGYSFNMMLTMVFDVD